MHVYYPLVLILIVANGNLLTVSAIDDIIIPLLNATSSITDAGQELPIQDENKLSGDDRNGEERLFESLRQTVQKGSRWLEHTVPLTASAREKRQVFEKWKQDLAKAMTNPRVGTVEEQFAKLKTFKSVRNKQDVSLIHFFHKLRSSRKHDGVYLQRLFFEWTEGIYSKELIGIWLDAGMKPKKVFNIVQHWKGGDSLSKSYDNLYTKIKKDPMLTVDKALDLLDDTAKKSA